MDPSVPGTEVGRRPLIVSNDNRHMLMGIRDSLSHHHRRQQQQDVQLRPELSQSTPNLLEKANTSTKFASSGGSNRFGYNKKAIQEITQSLVGLENPIQPDRAQLHPVQNGFDTDSIEADKIIQQVVNMGWKEVRSSIVE